jgi:hypothetical protein
MYLIVFTGDGNMDVDDNDGDDSDIQLISSSYPDIDVKSNVDTIPFSAQCIACKRPRDRFLSCGCNNICSAHQNQTTCFHCEDEQKQPGNKFSY